MNATQKVSALIILILLLIVMIAGEKAEDPTIIPAFSTETATQTQRETREEQEKTWEEELPTLVFPDPTVTPLPHP